MLLDGEEMLPEPPIWKGEINENDYIIRTYVQLVP